MTELVAYEDKIKRLQKHVEHILQRHDEDRASFTTLINIANDELKRLRDVLESIAQSTIDMPSSIDLPESDWYRGRFYDIVTRASEAVNPRSEKP